jgi:hypothetical protein
VGAWGFGVFENDTACDFASGVAGGGGVNALLGAIERVLSVEGNYLEAPDAEEGLAAAEIIARLRGKPGQETRIRLRSTHGSALRGRKCLMN